MIISLRVRMRSLAGNFPVRWIGNLTAESVQGAALSFQSVHDVHGGDGLALGVFGVGDGVPDHVLEEDLEDAAGLFVNQTGYTFDTSSASQSPDGRLGYSLDVVAKNFAMSLGATFSQTLSSFTTTSHDVFVF